MNGDIVRRGKRNEIVFVEYDGLYYCISNERAGASMEERQLRQCLNGEHGDLVQIVTNAMQSNGYKVRVAWSGIMNSLGDFGSVYPPVNAKTLDQINNL